MADYPVSCHRLSISSTLPVENVHSETSLDDYEEGNSAFQGSGHHAVCTVFRVVPERHDIQDDY